LAALSISPSVLLLSYLLSLACFAIARNRSAVGFLSHLRLAALLSLAIAKQARDRRQDKEGFALQLMLAYKQASISCIARDRRQDKKPTALR
jgi:hypothetical protein